MRLHLLDAHAPSWSAELDRIGMALRPRHNATLFPYHFLQVTLPRIGGGAGWVYRERTPAGVGFLLPRQRAHDGSRVFTLRYHALDGKPLRDKEADALAAAAAEALDGHMAVVYDTQAPQYYSATHLQIGSVDLGRPGQEEAAAVPSLHERIWGSPPEFLYPADLHSVDFAAGTSLVARVVEAEPPQMVGFLVGFTKFGGPPLPADWPQRFGGDLRLESQIMGVLPAYRGLRIANLLKKAQAEQAWREGIGIVNWTADPLQYPNAALNFGLLRAFASDFSPDLYPFRNNLNRVAASRVHITWLVGSERVRSAPMVGSRAAILDLAHQPQVPQLKLGEPAPPGLDGAPMIAVEIPADWTRLQQEDVRGAQQVRAATDAIFTRLVGIEEGRYCITGAAVEGERRFLLCERSGPALWAQLGSQ